MKDARAIGQGSERLDPLVYAGLLSRRGERQHRHVGTGDADVPSVGLFADRDGFGRALKRARPAHSDAPNLGQDQEPVIQCRSVAELLIGETVVAICPLEAGITGLLARLRPTSREQRTVGTLGPAVSARPATPVSGCRGIRAAPL